MNLIPNAISVVIPTYNRAHLIKESIQSVLDQTLQPYEIIVVDDFSTDNTEDVVNSFNSPLIKYVKNQRKKGANGARNTGILIAQGEYIAFHDSDDLFFKDKLRKQIQYMSQNINIGLCFCSIKKKNAGLLAKKVVPNKKIKRKNIKKKLREYNVVSTQAIVVRNSLAREVMFNEDLKRFQDWDFVLRFSKKYEIYHLNEALVLQIINSTSITSTENYLDAYEKMYHYHPDLVNHKLHNKIIYLQMLNRNNAKMMISFKIFLMKFFAKIKSIF